MWKTVVVGERKIVVILRKMDYDKGTAFATFVTSLSASVVEQKERHRTEKMKCGREQGF